MMHEEKAVLVEEHSHWHSNSSRRKSRWTFLNALLLIVLGAFVTFRASHVFSLVSRTVSVYICIFIVFFRVYSTSTRFLEERLAELNGTNAGFQQIQVWIVEQ